MEIHTTLNSAWRLIHSTGFLAIGILCLSSFSSTSSSSVNATPLPSSPLSSMTPKELEIIFNKALALASNSTSTLDQLAKALHLETAWPDHSSTTTNVTMNVSSCLRQTTSALPTSPDVTAQCLVSQGQLNTRSSAQILPRSSEYHASLVERLSHSLPRQIRKLTTGRECVSLAQVAALYKLDESSPLNQTEVGVVSPALIYSMLSCDQHQHQHGDAHGHGDDSLVRPSFKATWGYSFLLVTVINLCSLTGVLVLPCMKLKFYKILLMFMVALAVGTLVGCSLLCLVPEAFQLGHHDHEHGHNTDYVWKATTIVCGIYLFYLLEKLLRTIKAKRESPTLPSDEEAYSSESSLDKTLKLSNCHCNSQDQSNSHGQGKNHSNDDQNEAPVVYMIIFGDALHNFVDGLSIGSAFSQSIMTGVSVCVAVICEELPHELGDFAILINSGMRVRKAILYNFISSFTCYLGTFIGIILGENTQSREWIFAIASGMFLYISLVDMLPELNASLKTLEAKKLGGLKVFLIHNLGLLIGYSFMLVLAIYHDEIHL